jgi:hypothetical protein
MRRLFKKQRFLRLGRREEGVAAVEFAICLIPLLLIVMGILDFGSYFYYAQTVANASRAGARYAVQYRDATHPVPSAGEIKTWLETNYALGDEYNVTTPGTPPTKYGDPLTVQVTKNVTWFLSGFDILNLPTQVKGSTTMTLE